MEERIQFKNDRAILERSLSRLQRDESVSEGNKQLVTKYIRDAGLGKTVIGKAKKKIGDARRHAYVNHLCMLISFTKKDMDTITEEDMEHFIEALENGVVRSRKRFLTGRGFFRRGAPLSQRYVTDIKMSIRKYYKYLLGGNRTYPPLVEWIDTSYEPREVAALTPGEVERMVALAGTIRQRAIVQTLFDGGFRIGEFLNIRLRHVRFIAHDENKPQERRFFLRVPFSKTYARTVVLAMRESTKWMQLWLEKHPARPQVGPDGSVVAVDGEVPLFPMSDKRVREIVSMLGARATGKRVYPHLLRHSSATFWCNLLPYFVFCKRFGWSMTSSMPKRYIDRAGVDEMQVAQIYDKSALRRSTEQDALLGDHNEIAVRPQTELVNAQPREPAVWMTMTKNMPQRCIDREGSDELEMARVYLEKREATQRSGQVSDGCSCR